MRRVIIGILCMAGCTLFSYGPAFSQDHSRALAAADTSGFSVNKNNDWKIFNAYVQEYKKDSATIELIVQHSNTIDWKQEQYVGRIKQGLLQPKKERSLWFDLMGTTYMLRIEGNGKCFLQLMYGPLPSGTDVVIPMQLVYEL